ncbi:hypothetical protein BBP40_010935 [Aspergillus hancockii]|nr:hypothetical protein BBP40_010935 [Aspergillus hancockii]
MPPPEQSTRTVPSSRPTAEPQRTLACVLCQQRKVKCDRKFPCANCVKAGTHCVPALVPRQRRRRFPERELLERLRHYEGLLRENNIKFEPLHAPTTEKALGTGGSMRRDYPSDVNSEGQVPRNYWHLMNQMGKSFDSEDDDNDGDSNDRSSAPVDCQAVIRKAWDQMYKGNDEMLLFGSCETNVDLSTLHPEQVQIFRLWQIYLENVDPLLKVTHTPTLQSRIINAASNMTNISPTLEALMFSIYCIAILSLTEHECVSLFGSSREDLLKGYRFGCQQALTNSEFLRSNDRDCLTALLFYLISVKPDTDPRSVNSMLGVALRIAQRMGIHNESTVCTVLEGEMRRRLWWSLVLFDNRICEMSDHKSTILAPTWDCRTPLNVSDFEIQCEMKAPPTVHEKPTEAIFAVVRSELGNFARHSALHLDFTNPSLKSVAKDSRHGLVVAHDEIVSLEKTMEDKYLQYCNPENPLHFITIWSARGYLAKVRLLEHYSRYSSMQQTDAQHDEATSYALSILESDTQLINSPLTKGFFWFFQFHFPLPAYTHLVQDLEKRPTQKYVDKSWSVLSDNYDARFGNVKQDNRFSEYIARVVLQAWEAREAVFRELDKPLEQPQIVSDIKRKVMQTASNAQYSDIGLPTGAPKMNIDDFSMPLLMNFGGHDLPYGMEGQGPAGSGPGGYPDIPRYPNMDLDAAHWPTIDWYLMHGQGW